MTKEKWTRMGWWNYFVLQFFFIRWCRETRFVDARLNKTMEWRGIMFGVVPLTGWDNRPYRFVFGKPFYLWVNTRKV